VEVPRELRDADSASAADMHGRRKIATPDDSVQRLGVNVKYRGGLGYCNEVGRY
jgi:hypothetical protein